MALLVLPGGLMALSPQGPLTLLSMRALESCMARSARGLCPVGDALGELTRRNFPYNQRARAEQAGGPAGVPQHRMKSCPCRALHQGEVRVQSTGGSQLPAHWKAAAFEDRRWDGWDGIFLTPHPESTLWDKKSTRRCSTFFRKTGGATNWLSFFVSCHQDEQLTQVPAFAPRVVCQPANGIADLLPGKSMIFWATKCQ